MMAASMVERKAGKQAVLSVYVMVELKAEWMAALSGWKEVASTAELMVASTEDTWAFQQAVK